ncbi:MAG: biopolymer transporter ExbD [candidate division KSB1 bacterium]|nr:biopolymer transporter ExbD [candidate division KSB1 bacterium]MDZ7346120.1 biopolymer transporter ExbD [candidate division KSB1 bacterium]
MDLKATVRSRSRGHGRAEELNLTAVMNIFLILIPFLLLTASFVRLAVLEMTLPSLERGASTTAERPVINILTVRTDGLQLQSSDFKFPALPKGTDYDWQGLRRQLETIKQKYPSAEEIIIAPENSIRYEIIVTVMDVCRESGFPAISISG